jgi:hypothetical protein
LLFFAIPVGATTLTGFSTNGAQMDGMRVTATFGDASSEVSIWADTGATSGAAAGTGWSLSEVGDTFGGDWTLSNTSGKSLVRLVIEAIPGNTVFDIFDVPPGPDTPLSARGLPFTVLSGTAPTSSAYSVPIDISLGDLFGTLTLDWAAGFASGAANLVFEADTDSGTTDDPVRPVPEPASALLVGAALFALWMIRRKERLVV